MTTADGAVLSTTKIVDNGPPSEYWNIVILGDGYQAGQLAQYTADAQHAYEVIFTTRPFNSRRQVMNVYRVDVSSTDSGADDPAACGGTGTIARTFFDASFCNNGIQRLLEANTDTARQVATDQVPQWHVILMIVNSPIYGGSGGLIAVCSLAPGALEEIALHEIGHTIFRLADEYDYLVGCNAPDVDPPGTHDHHPLAQPPAADLPEPNVTLAANGAKWGDLILPATVVPTMSNPDCTRCDRRPSPVPAGTVGVFEGADHFHCGAYRPEYRCKMFENMRPFCAVCQRRILSVLPTRVPDLFEEDAAVAARDILDAGLEPVFTGSMGPGAWVWQQSPLPGRIVAAGSTVTLQFRTGPMP